MSVPSSDLSSDFRALAQHRHYKIRRPTFEQKKSHIDLIMTGLTKAKRANTVTLDIKYRGKKTGGDKWHWIEFRDPQGKAGWLYASADFIVFERRYDFVLTNRKKLIDWVNTTARIRHDLPYVKNTWQAKYRLFSRPQKKDSITQIQADDLLSIEGSHVWDKISSKK